MKTENFDDAIRRKVESINHIFKEEDIDRVHNYVSTNKMTISFWKTYGFGSVIATSVLMISGLLFWNIKQMQEQKVLINKIETLEKNEIQLKANQAEILKKVVASSLNESKDIETYHELNIVESKETKALSSENSSTASTSKIVTIDKYRPKNILRHQKKDQSENLGLLASNQEYDKENKSRSEIESKSNRKSIKSSNKSINKPTNLSENEKTENIASIQPLVNENEGLTTTENNIESVAIDSKVTEKSIEENKTSDVTIKNETTEISVADPKNEESSSSSVSSEAKGKKVLNAANVKKTKRNETPLTNNIAKMEKSKNNTNSSTSTARTEKTKNSTSPSSNSIAKTEKTKSQKTKRSQRNAANPASDDETYVLFKANKKEPNIVDNETLIQSKKDSLAENEQPVVTLKNTKFADSVASSPAIEENTLPILRPTFDYQVGLGVERTTTQNGLGIFSEMVLNKRLGFSAGLKLLVINNEKYNDAADYRQQRNRYFNGVDSPSLPDTSISNIGIQTTLFQLPLAVTYYHPLKRNFSLLFSLGTDIDLFVNQQLKYERDDDFNNQNKHEDHEIKRANIMINNVVISAGLQKQWKHFVFQASPYLSPQTRAVEYKKENIYFGFRVRAFYRF
jgi:hypothetical protein